MKTLLRWMMRLAAAALLWLALMAGAVWWWSGQPLPLRADTVEVSIEPGTPVRQVAQQWVDAGVDVPAGWLYGWLRVSGQARQIRAGSYEIERGATPRSLLAALVRGDEKFEPLRLPEGWTLRQIRAAVAAAPLLKHASASFSDAELARAIGLEEGASAEGRLFPDTYAYSRGVSDLTVLRRARQTMDKELAAAWAARRADLPLARPQDMLILASVVEKETGLGADRGKVAAVFLNRLKIGMPLQSDPTVIYGLGERFDGNLRRADLQADTPYNTYTRGGLPPTPIAMPSRAALMAVAQPAAIKALYFVARGDGSSVFSQTLGEHNQAVDRYQRGITP